MLLILMFMYIFSFKIYSLFDSTFLVGLLMLYCFIIKKEYRRIVLSGIKNKYVININLFVFLLIIWSLISLIINKSSDFTYIKTLVHLYLNLIIGYLVFNYYDFIGQKKKILNYIILAFFIQSCLQWLFFIFPSISKIFNIFRTESMILNNYKYDGYRGLALSTTGFFGLSSAYGLISILYFSKHNTLFDSRLKKYLFLLIIYSGTFFAGRTGFISLPFILILIIVDIKKNRIRYNKNKLFKDFFIVLLCFAALFFGTYKIPKFNNMYNYAFELVKNVFDGKGFFTTSTDKMFKMYNVDISPGTLVVGDGKYTINSKDGKHYYQNTDIGYLRKILFFGVPGLLLSIVFELFIFEKNIQRRINKIVFVLLLIFELKGEVIGIAILINSILLLYNMLDLFDIKENNGRIKQLFYSKINVKKPLISIIVPSYNSSKYILQTIDSILKQKYKNFEIIIVDDGSSDNSLELLKDRYEKNSSVSIFSQENLGAPSARNFGITKASGDLIVFFDSDDLMERNYLSDALKYYDDEDLIITNFIRFNDNNPKLNEELFKINPMLNLEENLYLIPAFPGNKIYKKSIIINNKLIFDNVKIAQDLNFYLKYLCYTRKVRIIKKCNVNYRIHDKSISTTYNMNLLDVEKSIEMASIYQDSQYKYLFKMVRLKHYTTQLMKLSNYDDASARLIRNFFRKNAFHNRIYFIGFSYFMLMYKYIFYQWCIFVLPIRYGKKITSTIKRRISDENK